MKRSRSAGGKPGRVTRADVAELAGVSTATVSYVLNHTGRVPERTAELVREAARRLNYRPNLVARGLATDRTSQLAIVLNDMANPINADLILGFEGEAIRNGYFVNICTGDRNIDDYFDNFAARRIDGLLIEALPHKYHREKVTALVDAGVRIVTFGRFGIDSRLVSSIETDYEDAMRQAIEHLVHLGHRHIAYVSGLAASHRLDGRLSGFRRAMRDLGVTRPVTVVPEHSTDARIADGARFTGRLLKMRRAFTAIVTTNDLMAIGAMNALAAAGLSVPADVSVVGFDGTSITELCSPQLTSVATDHREIGRLACTALRADITGGCKTHHVNTPTLVVRGSTAAPPSRAGG